MEEFNKYIKTLTKEEQTLLKDFFTSFDEHCLLNKKNKEKLRDDFEKAILYYYKKFLLKLLCLEQKCILS